MKVRATSKGSDQTVHMRICCLHMQVCWNPPEVAQSSISTGGPECNKHTLPMYLLHDLK